VRFDPVAILGGINGFRCICVAPWCDARGVRDRLLFLPYRHGTRRQKMSLQESGRVFKSVLRRSAHQGPIRQFAQCAHEEADGRGSKASSHHQPYTLFGGAFPMNGGSRRRSALAKGVANLALKIREIAGIHDIRSRDVRLRRACIHRGKIDDEIPVGTLPTGADVIGYVMGLKRGLSRRSMIWCLGEGCLRMH